MLTDEAIELDLLYQGRLLQYQAAPSPVALRRVSKLGILLLDEIRENCAPANNEEVAQLSDIMESMLVTGNMLRWVLGEARQQQGLFVPSPE